MTSGSKRNGLVAECIARAGSVPDLVFALATKGVKMSGSALYKATSKTPTKTYRRDFIIAVAELFFKDDMNAVLRHMRAEDKKDS